MTREVVAFVLGDRSESSCRMLWERIPMSYKTCEKKRWYAVSLILAPAYIFSVQPENIKELKETADCYLSEDCYQVMEGDCLGKIAERHHVSVQEIILANKEKHLQLMDNPNLIYPRLRLKIPRKGAAQ